MVGGGFDERIGFLRTMLGSDSLVIEYQFYLIRSKKNNCYVTVMHYDPHPT